MIRMYFCLVVLFLFALPTAFAHSWVACSDYRIVTTEDENVFNPTNCKAYPRNYKNGHGSDFGVDTGFDYRPNNAPLCKYPLSGNDYSTFYNIQFAMASYVPGQEVCLAWPSKNHVAATCNNANIPDNGLKVFVSGANPTADAGNSGALRLVKDFGKNPEADAYVGFQHCPRFCQNADKSTCTGCFTIPSDLQVGSTYTFVWQWAFNDEADLYSSCWEAQIVSSDPNDPSTTASSQQTTGSSTGNSMQTTDQSTTATPESNPTTSSFSSTSDSNSDATTGERAVSNEQTSCTSNEECESGVCEVSGVCKKANKFSTAVIIAIVLACALFVVVVVATLMVLFRYRLIRFPYF